ncbi:T6SS immunity protein Tdi1 domain-containing protein [Dyella agri]|uniref:DUF1851 domain-containing protein n=1 Tax=Dyella agri TaxID=1926869 RepID=A0ABW8KD11_9GAMM
MKVTWRELTVSLSGQSTGDLLHQWRWLVPETMSLHMVSALGDAFLQDHTGAIFWLDAGGAELTRIADSPAHFDTLRQQPALANEWFAPQLVGNLLSSGHVLGAGQCFSYKVPLTLGGQFQPDNFAPSDLSVHFHTLGQIQAQAKNLPVGTRISSVKLGE